MATRDGYPRSLNGLTNLFADDIVDLDLGDYYTKTEADGLFVDVAGDTMTGDLIQEGDYVFRRTSGDVTITAVDQTDVTLTIPDAGGIDQDIVLTDENQTLTLKTIGDRLRFEPQVSGTVLQLQSDTQTLFSVAKFPNMLGTTDEIVMVDLTQTLTNKTINTIDNSISIDTSDVVSGTFADARISASNVTQHETAIDHNNLLNYVADEHIDHSTVNIIAGTSLTGGGDITSDVTLNVDETSIDHDNLLNYVADEHIDHTTIDISAGVGLSGGGDISASRTIDLDINSLTQEVSPDPANDFIAVYDVTAGAHRKVLLTDFGAGENNTASNVGAGGVGVFKQKTGVDFEFKNINAGSNKITVTDDVANDEIDIDIDESNIIHQNLSGAGTNTHAQIDSHIADGTIHFTEASIDHGSISGLLDDDHTQYALLDGRSGGQTLSGGDTSGNTMTIRSNSANPNNGAVIVESTLNMSQKFITNLLGLFADSGINVLDYISNTHRFFDQTTPIPNSYLTMDATDTDFHSRPLVNVDNIDATSGNSMSINAGTANSVNIQNNGTTRFSASNTQSFVQAPNVDINSTTATTIVNTAGSGTGVFLSTPNGADIQLSSVGGQIKFTFGGTDDYIFVNGGFIPATNNTKSLGGNGFAWSEFYVRPPIAAGVADTQFLNAAGQMCAVVSDKRYKKEDEIIPLNWTKFNNVQPKVFKYKTTEELEQDKINALADEETTQGDLDFYNNANLKSGDGNRPLFGFMAQELKTAYPLMVSGANEETGYAYSVNYKYMIPVLVRHVQDLHAKCVDLEARLTALEGN